MKRIVLALTITAVIAATMAATAAPAQAQPTIFVDFIADAVYQPSGRTAPAQCTPVGQGFIVTGPDFFVFCTGGSGSGCTTSPNVIDVAVVTVMR